MVFVFGVVRKRHQNAVSSLHLSRQSANVQLPSADDRATILQRENQRVRRFRRVQFAVCSRELVDVERMQRELRRRRPKPNARAQRRSRRRQLQSGARAARALHRCDRVSAVRRAGASLQATAAPTAL